MDRNDVHTEEMLYDRLGNSNSAQVNEGMERNSKDVSVTNNAPENEEVIFTRPLMPYGLWVATPKERSQYKVTPTLVSKLPHWDPTLNDPVCPKSDLQHLINILDPFCTPVKTTRDEQFLSDVNTMLNKTVEQLRKERKLFVDCLLIPTGSIVENTKVGNPRELDFLVALPYLLEQKLFIPCQYLNCDLFAKIKKNIVFDILSDWDPKQTSLSEETDGENDYLGSKIEDVRVAIAKIFRIYLLQNILPRWTLTYPSALYSDSSFYKLSVATQFSFINTEYNINIKADICFCAPLDSSAFEHSFDEFETDFYFRFLRELSHKYCLYGIIGSVAAVYTSDEYDRLVFRIAIPELEQKAFKIEDASGARSKCYRLAKCIITKFLPEKWTPKLGCTLCDCPYFLRSAGLQDQSCQMCWHPSVPSFILKTIIFYMSNIYPEHLYWSDTNLGNRLIELFLILHHSFLQDYNRYRISAFYLPEVVSLDNGASERDEDENDFNLKFGFNFGSFLVPAMERSCYEYGKVFSNDFFTSEFGDSVGQYISHVRGKEWSLRGLLSRLKDLLLELKQTTTISGASENVRQMQDNIETCNL